MLKFALFAPLSCQLTQSDTLWITASTVGVKVAHLCHTHSLKECVCVCVCMGFFFSLYFLPLAPLFPGTLVWKWKILASCDDVHELKKKQADPQNPLCFLFTAAAGPVYFSATGVSWSAPASVSVSVSLHKNSRSHMWSGTSGSIYMPVVVGNTLCRKMISHVLAASGPPAGNI